MKRRVLEGYFGKYREIVLAVAFFLVFDLAVLVLNFLISFQISQDATAVNLAGRQRMLSQSMTKALLLGERALARGEAHEGAVEELARTVTLFDRTLTAFRDGGTVSGGDGQPVLLEGLRAAEGRTILDQAAPIWDGYRTRLQPLLVRGPLLQEQVDSAVDYARANNLALLRLMNDLTTHLERTAADKASTLRGVQTAGILLALLNFAFILQKFIRRLSATDRRIEVAQRETAEILGTVKEGLFLLDRDLRIGLLYSRSLAEILGHDIQPGMDFRELLAALVPEQALKPARDYIDVLLQDWVKEALVTELNPLSRVEVRSAQGARRFLSLQFNRALVEGRISHLLVTVSDVTAVVELEAQVAQAHTRARGEVEALLDLLQVDSATLDEFLLSAERKLLQVNDHLRSAGGGTDHRRPIAAILRLVHAIKGDAAALRLAMFEDLAQQFEQHLAGLRDKGPVSGDDLIALPLPLDEFLQRIALVRTLAQRVASFQNSLVATPVDTAALVDSLESLAQRIAGDHGKEVKLVAALETLPSLPLGAQRELRDIVVQLLRNAVVHGIEPATQRRLGTKPAQGTIHVSLKRAPDGQFEFLLRDDGCGLSPRRVREALVLAGRYTAAQIAEFSDHQVLLKLFEPGISTAQRVSRDAGHGIGLDLVLHKVQQLRARLRVSTQENVYTQFSFRFAP